MSSKLSWLLCSAVLLAGCGGDDAPPRSAVVTATPPPTEEMKLDLLTAEIQLDAYKVAEGTFTADETLLGAAFPGTVTIKDADTDSFSMAAYDEDEIRYVLRRDGETVERTCEPADEDACPGGEW